MSHLVPNAWGRALCLAAVAGLSVLGAMLATRPALGQGISDIIVQSNDPAPAGDGRFYQLQLPRLNDGGQAAFEAFILTNGGSTVENGVFRGAGGKPIQIAREGEEAPDGNGTFWSFEAPSLNDADQAAFAAELAGTSGKTRDNEGIFLGAGGTIIQIVREGQPPPDRNGTFSIFGAPSLNDPGQVAFAAELTGTSGGWADNSGIFRGAGGALTQIARAGQAAPDGNGTFFDFGTPSLNDAGQAAFDAELTGTSGGTSDNRGIFRGSGGTLTQIAREGQAAPDGNGTLSSFGYLALNNTSQAAFDAELTGTSGGTSDNTGIFRGAGGPLTQIARKGQVAPDGNGTFSTFYSPALNNAGQVAFEAFFIGTSGGTTDDEGLYLGDGLQLVRVARKGQPLAGSTIAEIDFAHIAPDENDGLSDFAEVAYRARLADGRWVIVRFTPELHWRTEGSGDWGTTANWTVSIAPAAVHSVYIDPAGSLTVDGPTSDVTVYSLQVGGNRGLATLRLRNGGSIAATQDIVVETTGRVEGDGGLDGTVENYGEIAAENVTITGLLNNVGLISGNGRLYAANIINTGDIRAGSGERLLLSGPNLENQGQVEVIGGQLEVLGAATNSPNGQIATRDATLRFNNGLLNAGQLAVSFGTTDLFGDVENNGSIAVPGGAQLAFYDDLTNNSTMVVASSGSTPGQVAIFGMLSGLGSITGGGHVYLLGGVSPGASPGQLLIQPDTTVGEQCKLVMELAGEEVHDRLLVSGNLQLAGTLAVELLDDYQPALGAKFDLLDWGTLEGEFSQVLLPELSPGLGWDSSQLYRTGSVRVVPEPGSLSLLGLMPTCAAAWLWRRCRRKV